jgi:hypothetical protein
MFVKQRGGHVLVIDHENAQKYMFATLEEANKFIREHEKPIEKEEPVKEEAKEEKSEWEPTFDFNFGGDLDLT